MKQFPNPKHKTLEEIQAETQHYQKYLQNYSLPKRVRREIIVHLNRLKQREQLLYNPTFIKGEYLEIQ